MIAAMHWLGSIGSISAGSLFFLVAALGLALSFEFVNGFHDTANAVATVIYLCWHWGIIDRVRARSAAAELEAEAEPAA